MAAKTQLDILIEVYREAQLSLIGIISGQGGGAGTKTYYNTVLKQLETLMDRLSAETGKYIETAVPAEYRKALDETYDYFQKNKLRMKRPDMFAQIHSDAVYELSREMQYHIDQGISLAGRRVMRYLDESRDNILRQQGLRSAAVKIASGQTVLDMQKNLMQRLAGDGFLTVQYGSGDKAYQVGLDTYAAMVARSTTREAGNLARENQLAENGYDLMKMTEHYPTCEKCAQLQGRVYSISGRDKRFPPLSRAFSSGYRNVHPNCRHVMTYWIEELQSPEELAEALERSGAPFGDCRSDGEKALYSKQQAENRKMRSDRSQYERYKARLGEDAPKTFSSFRRMKNQGGEKWQNLQKLYRSKYEPAEIDVQAPPGNGGAGKLYEPEKIPDKAVDNPGGSGIIEAYRGNSINIVESNEISSETTERIRRAAETVTDDFPVLNEHIENINFGNADGAVAINSFSPLTGENNITFSEIAFSDPAHLQESLVNDFARGWSYETNHIESLVAHEMGHAAHISLALKRAGIKYGKPLSAIERRIFEQEYRKIAQEVYLTAFTTESYDEIQALCVKQLGGMVYADSHELIAQSFGNYYYGVNKSKIARSIVEFFKKELS